MKSGEICQIGDYEWWFDEGQACLKINLFPSARNEGEMIVVKEWGMPVEEVTAADIATVHCYQAGVMARPFAPEVKEIGSQHSIGALSGKTFKDLLEATESEEGQKICMEGKSVVLKKLLDGYQNLASQGFRSIALDTVEKLENNLSEVKKKLLDLQTKPD